jgi:hypothetical protein
MVHQWLLALGWCIESVDASTVQISNAQKPIPPFFVRVTENWLLLAIVPVIPHEARRPSDLSRRLLAVNRDIRLAKFSYDEDNDVVLNAELPTESLDPSEVRDAVGRMVRYVEHYAAYFCQINETPS